MPRLWWWQQRLAPAAPVWSVNVHWCDRIRPRVTGRVALWLLDAFKGGKGKSSWVAPPPENQHDNGTSDIWRCISERTWRFSNVMFVFSGASCVIYLSSLTIQTLSDSLTLRLLLAFRLQSSFQEIWVSTLGKKVGWNTAVFCPPKKQWQFDAVDGSEIRKKTVEVGSLSHYLEWFRHCWWLFGISSINTFIIVFSGDGTICSEDDTDCCSSNGGQLESLKFVVVEILGGSSQVS